MISGEPGIGKTRLAEELKAVAREKGVRCLSSKCYRGFEGGALFPYSSCVQFIREFSSEASIQLFYRVSGADLDQIVRLVPELINSLPKDPVLTPPPPKTPERPSVSAEDVQREEMHFLQAVTHFFFNLSNESPLLLFVDDWQWSDAASLKFLQFARGSGLYEHRILILCAFREMEIDDRGGLRGDSRAISRISEFLMDLERERAIKLVQLKRFDEDNLGVLLKKLFFEEEVQRDFISLLQAKTGGNPFFVGEILRALAEEGMIYKDDEGWWRRREISDIAIPKSVSNVVRHRLERLGADTVSTLSMASVLGETFEFEILNRVLPDLDPERLRAQLEDTVKTSLILRKNSSHYTFCDESVRDSLYAEIPQDLVKTYHRPVAMALEGFFKSKGDDCIKEHASELAHHYLRSGNPRKSLEYYILAAKEASRLYAHDLACKNFHQALGLLSKLEDEEGNRLVERAELLDLLGFEAQFVPSEFTNVTKYWEEAVTRYETARLPKRAARILSQLVLIYHLMLFDLEKSSRSRARALRLLESEDNADYELANLHASGIIDDAWRGNRGAGLERVRKAIELGEKSGAFGAISLANSFPATMSAPEEFEKAKGLMDHAINVSLDNNVTMGASLSYFHKAECYANLKGASGPTLDFFQEAIDYSAKTGQFMINLFAKVELAFQVYLPLGEWRKAEALALNALESVKTLPPSSFFAIVTDATYGQIMLHKGDYERAQDYLTRVESRLGGLGIFQLEVPLRMGLARLCIERGEYERAKYYILDAYCRSKKRGLIIINCLPHVQLLSGMVELALRRPMVMDLDVDSLVVELREASARIKEEWAHAYLHKTVGLCHFFGKEPELAESSFQRSVETWRNLGWRYELGLTLLLLGEVRERQDKKAGAIVCYDESLRILEDLGARAEIQRATRMKERCEHLMDSSRLGSAPIEFLADEKRRKIFLFLVRAYLQDSVVNKLPHVNCGWRTLGAIERETGIPASFLYGKSRGMGPTLRDLIKSKLVESAIFSGQRGRGGEVTRVRIAYETNPVAKEYVERELRDEPG